MRATDDGDPDVALEASEFWLIFASLDEEAYNAGMMAHVAALFLRLLPQLLRGVVYPADKIEELMEGNTLDEVGGADQAQDLAPAWPRPVDQEPGARRLGR